MSAYNRSLRRILLIDDNPDDRLLAIRELQREFPDIEIEEVSTIKNFEQALITQSFDLVITDYELNYSNGLEVLQIAKSYDRDIPVVMFTNSGSQEVAVEAMKAGLDDYVIKSPKHLIRLTQAVRSTWENSQTRRKAVQLEIHFQVLLNQLTVGVFRSTPDGEFLEVNHSFLKLLGLNSLEQTQEFFRKQSAFKIVDRTQGNRWDWETQIHCPNGKTIWVQISETLVKLNGEMVIDGLLNDITETKQSAIAIQQLNQSLEHRVRERTAQLEAINQELESFAYSVSHDLRAPIRQIDGFVSLLQDHLVATEIDKTSLHYLQRISLLTAKAGNMIDDLLEYSRTGSTQMQYLTVDMNQLVHAVQQQLMREHPERTIVWQINPLPKVQGDRRLLQQVWQNLIENAVKYTRFCSQAEITIDSLDQENEVTFFVRDNGVGFDMNYSNRLFGIFQRLHSSDQFEGTGIGLANVKRIIHRHNGSVWAESLGDLGATFYFSLPNLKRVAEG